MTNQSIRRIQILGALLTLQVIATCADRLFAKGAFPAGTYASGDFTVVFKSDATFRVSEKGEAVVDGSYAVEGDQITLTDKQGRYACLDEGPGKYTWKQSGQTLTFAKLDDSCPGRERILTRQALAKQHTE